ncbi:MAG: nickel pincer cofactor biosynthesis protein LarB [Candidatus Methanospirare jalkutatii]|nr:MAG: nickel pincer cofactor biosynthesis protein LarB [Candidatus Methanospirare jalkutatii]UYZ40781.1 MAG: nickel pincer cofactor biosynthesis protein LarB [Candidatus Methanospirare jalkutatii]
MGAEKEAEKEASESDEMLTILEKLASGEISVKSAYEELKRLRSLRILRNFARIDTARKERTGIPEIILATGKSEEQVAEIALALAESQGFALVTRASSPSYAKAVREKAERAGFHVEENKVARTILVKHPAHEFKKMGKIAILSAGTADIKVAEEAKIVAQVCGCEIFTAYDVGIAGLHRLSEPLERILSEGVVAIIVVAGMEGALPSVVASLVDIPVIAVPTSVGYGLGGGGFAAILSMIQSCTPGIAVVNIDNGVAAGALAARIARVAAVAKAKAKETAKEAEKEAEKEEKED